MKHISVNRHNVPRETFSAVDDLVDKYQEELKSFLDHLLWWNKRVNLVSRSVSRETVWEHIRHSLLLSQLEVFLSADLIMDTGTGGGLPGLPLAITHPKKHLLLNDLVTKKCLAIKQIAKKMEVNNIGIVDGSVEQIQQDQPFLLISKHAFKINELYQMTQHLPWTSMVFYKGEDLSNELENISAPLEINSYSLSTEEKFYEGKSIVVVNRL
ncbi:16S rRNA m(7)G-527 methyltransferase [Fodinibius salinus]|uniref:Ribosomal RNA small subunit methyltransferase G n=1 Tax=Fodinibius salinus TaxID=860790 RepID=A0A5D3YJP0_9BACT|nr:RsmG family class I SAM-dependent methyltransferase [Fodinibius salinus]TYP93728.1 16S rRNA m(7)G-527 methyltransferase [Fodinibius salinus]